MVVKAAIGFLNTQGDDELIGTVQAVIDGLTDNPSFPTPNPSLETVKTALAEFITAKAATVNGGKENTSAKNALRAGLVSLMRQLASYVTVNSYGDFTVLLSSAYPCQKPDRTRVGILPAPDAPTLRFGGRTGVLDATIGPIYGAATYNWRVALADDPEKVVQTAQTTAGRATLEDLTPGKIYNVQANAVGAAGPSDWSDVAQMMVM